MVDFKNEPIKHYDALQSESGETTSPYSEAIKPPEKTI
jgi:hypothetical protein